MNSNAGQQKWSDARSYCQNKGGDLIKINSNDEKVGRDGILCGNIIDEEVL